MSCSRQSTPPGGIREANNVSPLLPHPIGRGGLVKSHLAAVAHAALARVAEPRPLLVVVVHADAVDAAPTIVDRTATPGGVTRLALNTGAVLARYLAQSQRGRESVDADSRWSGAPTHVTVLADLPGPIVERVGLARGAVHVVLPVAHRAGWGGVWRAAGM